MGNQRLRGLAFVLIALASATAAGMQASPPVSSPHPRASIVVPETFLIRRVLTTAAIPPRHYEVVVEIPPVKFFQKPVPKITKSSGDVVIDSAALAFAVRSLVNPALQEQLKQHQLVFELSLDPPRVRPDAPTVSPGQERSYAQNPNFFAPRPHVPLGLRLRQAHGERAPRMSIQVTYNGVTGRPDRVGILQGSGKEIFDSTTLYWVLTNWRNLQPNGTPVTQRLGIRFFL